VIYKKKSKCKSRSKREKKKATASGGRRGIKTEENEITQTNEGGEVVQ
jgi:hypothetical protein